MSNYLSCLFIHYITAKENSKTNRASKADEQEECDNNIGLMCTMRLVIQLSLLMFVYWLTVSVTYYSTTLLQRLKEQLQPSIKSKVIYTYMYLISYRSWKHSARIEINKCSGCN